MAGIAVYAQKNMLDHICGGATAAVPATHAVGLSLGVPSSVSASEMATGSGVTRQTCGFGAGASPAGSVSNATAMTFGPFSAGATVQGLQVWDNLSSGSGNMLFYGTLATARTLGAGDSLVFAIGALTITLA